MSDFVFKEVDGKLIYVGDFEGLYKNESDPWEQSGGEFHKNSRFELVKLLRKYPVNNILVVGCGLGYETCVIQQLVCNNTEGMDISEIAIQRAKLLFPFINFRTGDIRKEIIGNYDMIILSSMLWYILLYLTQVVENVFKALNDKGYFVINQAFIENQRYGKDIIDGFGGLMAWVNSLDNFQLMDVQYEKNEKYKYNDGTVILRKK